MLVNFFDFVVFKIDFGYERLVGGDFKWFLCVFILIVYVGIF